MKGEPSTRCGLSVANMSHVNIVSIMKLCVLETGGIYQTFIITVSQYTSLKDKVLLHELSDGDVLIVSLRLI